MSQRALLVIGIVGVLGAVTIGAWGLTSQGSGFPTMIGFSGTTGKTISMDQAQQSVRAYIDRTGNSDLKIDELMEFQQNFYALIKEASTGIGAFELVVDKRTGAVMPEPGPNMMWNTKYSPMAGTMMGGTGIMGGSYRIGPSTPMTVGADQAAQIAQSWLDHHFGGNTAGTPDAFYGYYTFHFEHGGQVAGMLSVNGFSGQVWYHSWHGRFVQARDFGA